MTQYKKIQMIMENTSRAINYLFLNYIIILNYQVELRIYYLLMIYCLNWRFINVYIYKYIRKTLFKIEIRIGYNRGITQSD
jgi:hypothetical protein